ncbi:MAG TPA: hypothetical protein VGT61_01875 [Thermomicrobiales bacterium]|nr:hypothetical protein [Thermomicrobiales bacterium]
MSDLPLDIPSEPTFMVGRIYRRRDLHDAFGGSYQSGISASRRAPVIFIFTTETGEAGERHGYHDGWQPDGTFHYSGEGQKGDMAFTKGNLAIRAHHDGQAIYLIQCADQGSIIISPRFGQFGKDSTHHLRRP